MLQLLTAPTATATQAFRYLVELASNELELDRFGELVPSDYKTLDVVVEFPTIEAITALLQEGGYLNDWGIVGYSVPSDCDCF